MKYCSSCNVLVDNPIERCPLCFTSLTQHDASPEFQSYPSLLQKAARYNLLLRILIMLSLTACAVCVTVNLLTLSRWGGMLWSLVVVGNIAYMWIAVSTAVRKRAKLGVNIIVQVISLSLLMLLLDWFSGQNNWALNYVVPFLLITATLSITIITIIRRMDAGSFILYFFLIALMGFIPIFLLAFGLTTVRWPALVSAGYSGLSLISLFIFADRTTKQELKKRFHI